MASVVRELMGAQRRAQRIASITLALKRRPCIHREPHPADNQIALNQNLYILFEAVFPLVSLDGPVVHQQRLKLVYGVLQMHLLQISIF